MNGILIIALVVTGLGSIVLLFMMMKKAGKKVLKLPTNFLIFFFLYAIIGLTGFLLQNQIAEKPILIGLLLFVVSITGGIIMTHNLYERWEWSQTVDFGKKLLYLSGMALVSIIAFLLSFLLCEHRGIPHNLWTDLAWWLGGIILVMLMPLIIMHWRELWNDIPVIKKLKPIFQLPLGDTPPFIETGGASLHFQFIIPLTHQSKELVKSRVAVPFNITLAEVFHYKLHEHNIVKRFNKKIAFAEDNERSKIYGWSFYRLKRPWWGWWSKKVYLNPQAQVGGTIIADESVFVERVKMWT